MKGWFMLAFIVLFSTMFDLSGTAFGFGETVADLNGNSMTFLVRVATDSNDSYIYEGTYHLPEADDKNSGTITINKLICKESDLPPIIFGVDGKSSRSATTPVSYDVVIMTKNSVKRFNGMAYNDLWVDVNVPSNIVIEVMP